MVSLTMMQRTLKYEEAIDFLKEKAVGFPGVPRQRKWETRVI